MKYVLQFWIKIDNYQKWIMNYLNHNHINIIIFASFVLWPTSKLISSGPLPIHALLGRRRPRRLSRQEMSLLGMRSRSSVWLDFLAGLPGWTLAGLPSRLPLEIIFVEISRRNLYLEIFHATADLRIFTTFSKKKKKFFRGPTISGGYFFGKSIEIFFRTHDLRISKIQCF